MEREVKTLPDNIFEQIRSFIERYIQRGETYTDFYSVRINSRYDLLEPQIDRERIEYDLRERLPLDHLYSCQDCEANDLDEDIFNLEKKSLWSHLKKYHADLFDE